MAMTINSSPVLTGESAKAFIEEAERNDKLPTPTQSPNAKHSCAKWIAVPANYSIFWRSIRVRRLRGLLKRQLGERKM